MLEKRIYTTEELKEMDYTGIAHLLNSTMITVMEKDEELGKCYSEIEEKDNIIAESYKISSGTSSSKIDWLIERGKFPVGIVLCDEDTADRTIVDFGACVKINREDFRKLLTPNDYKLKFEKISK